MIGEVVRVGIISFSIACAALVSAHARRRGVNAPLWALLAFLFREVILPIYLFLQEPSQSRSTGPVESRLGAGAS